MTRREHCEAGRKIADGASCVWEELSMVLNLPMVHGASFSGAAWSSCSMGPAAEQLADALAQDWRVSVVKGFCY